MEMRGGCDQLIDVPNHIGGKKVQASNGEWILNYAPSTGNIISRIPKSNHQDVNNAVRVAKEAGLDLVYSSYFYSRPPKVTPT